MCTEEKLKRIKLNFLKSKKNEKEKKTYFRLSRCVFWALDKVICKVRGAYIVMTAAKKK